MPSIRTEPTFQPPVARVDPRPTVVHGLTLSDPYAWMQQRDDPEVHDYLKAENAFTEQSMGHTEACQEKLYREILSRTQETDLAVPVRRDDMFYYFRTAEGLQYPIYCRRKGSLEAPEEILFDLNTFGDGRDFLSLGILEVSPDHRLLAYSLDDDGSERYRLEVLDLESRELVDEPIAGTTPSFIWANDSHTFFYAIPDESQRPCQVFRHVIGQTAADPLVFREDDEQFYLSLFKTRSRQFLGIHLASHTTSEIHVLEAETPMADFRQLIGRRTGVELQLDHHEDFFYLLTNEEAANFRLLRLPVSAPDRKNWQEVIPHHSDVCLDGIDCFRDHLVIQLRQQGLSQIRIRDLRTGEEHEIAFDELVYSVAAQDNLEFDTQILRFVYSSLITPNSVYDYDMVSRRRTLLRRAEVLGGYEPERYTSERLFARAADGALVPISLVYRQDRGVEGPRPTLLYGYGAYGRPTEPRFSSIRLSLLDRGFVCAIAHVRGGGELGRCWYESGKLLDKQNSFSDFIAVAEHLLSEGYTSSDRLVIQGGSAGGLLVGTALNQRPELFAAAVADAPFVDILNTMLDPSLPLTTLEFDEWGDPRDRRIFDAIRAYSPYDNVSPVEYPCLLVTARFQDPRVQYWEPAKWIARLRALGTGRNRILLKVDMGGGHSGPSGRYNVLREGAFVFAFIFDCLGIEP